MIECSLCDMVFDEEDDLIDKRIERHKEKHTRGWSHKAQRDGGGNNTMGIVEWYTLC